MVLAISTTRLARTHTFISSSEYSRAVCGRTEEERVLVTSRHQVDEQLPVEEDIGVEDNETVAEPIAGKPERVQAVGRSETRVADDVHLTAAHPPHFGCAVPGDDGDGGDAALAERGQLALDQGVSADASEALGMVADHALQPPAPARGENEAPHARSDAVATSRGLRLNVRNSETQNRRSAGLTPKRRNVIA